MHKKVYIYNLYICMFLDVYIHPFIQEIKIKKLEAENFLHFFESI